MKNLYLIQTGEITEKFKEIIDYSTKDYTPTLITSSGELPDLKGKKIIFAIELDQCGFNIPLFDILLKLIPLFSLWLYFPWHNDGNYMDNLVFK